MMHSWMIIALYAQTITTRGLYIEKGIVDNANKSYCTMVDHEPSSSSPAAHRSFYGIASLNPNDVLFGRDTGTRSYVGNQNFRTLADDLKEDYNYAHKNKDKNKIARDLFDEVHSLGGRFLKRIEAETLEEEEMWHEVEEKVALEKCKQYLRTKGDQGLPVATNEKLDIGEASFQGQNAASSPGVGAAVNPASLEELGGTFLQSPVSAVHLAPLPQSMLQRLCHEMYLAANTSAAVIHGSFLADSAHSSPLGNLMMRQQIGSVSAHARQGSRQPTAKRQVVADEKASRSILAATTVPSEDDVPAASEDDMLEFLLPLFEQNTNITMFTEEQEKIEQANLTEEEKAAALCDLFGKSCSFATHNAKRPRLDFDNSSIEFLVQQMRLELDRIPQHGKRALVDAQLKCRAEEFSNARLERFLRCEGMNAKVRQMQI
jgi:hypothetical protein